MGKGEFERAERGANLVELAIVAPLLIILFVGIYDIGRAFHSYMIITNAAREGARFASRFPTDLAKIKSTAKQETAGSTVTLTDSDIEVPLANTTRGQPIVVIVRYRFNTLFTLFAPAGYIDMSAETRMVIFGPDPLEP